MDRRRRPAAARRAQRLGRARGRHGAARAARARPRAAGGRLLPSGDGGQSRRLHPVQALRSRLPRGAGQRRHRLCGSRRGEPHRVRRRQPDGRQHLRRLRRMCAGLPDRRADAEDDARQPALRPQGRLGLPVLRRRLPADLQHPRRADRQRRRPRRPGQPRPAVREGPLRLRLCRPSAAADEAAGAPCRGAEEPRPHPRPGRLAGGVPRGELGRGARRRRRRAGKAARRARREVARRLRLGQGQQRGGLPVPEAGAHRLRQQQRRPLHAAVPCVERGGAARRRRLGGGEQSGRRCRACRPDLRHRLEPDLEPSGRRDLDEERRAARRAHRARRPAPHRPRAARLAHAAVQRRHRRGDAQRADPHGDRRRPGRRGLRSRAGRQLRRAGRGRAPLQPGGDGGRSAAFRRRRCARWRAPSPPRRAR